MGNDEIKQALKTKSHITYGGIIYDHAQAWRVTFCNGKYIIVVAPADKCEVSNG